MPNRLISTINVTFHIATQKETMVGDIQGSTCPLELINYISSNRTNTTDYLYVFLYFHPSHL